jgi:hypothetical protein
MPDTKITALTAISTVDPAVDVLPIVDVSDTTMAASGTTKKITSNQILGAGGTANLASATVTGAATAARLIVTGSTIPANGVYLPAANTVGFAANSLDQYRIEPLGIFTWYDGAGGTRMTLNSTGLGAGVTPITGHRISSVGPIGLSGGPNSYVANGNYCSMYYTDGSGASFPFLEYGNLVIQPRNERNVVIATAPTAGNHVARVVVKLGGQVRFVPLAADPSGAESGDVYYNSTSNKLKCYNGTTWNDLF